MKDLTDLHLFDEIIRDAVKHRTLHTVYYEAGYRDGVRDSERRVIDEKPIGGNSAA
jgi:hypothetical protein